MLPPLSVIIPTRNDAGFLAGSVGSVLGQGYPGELEVLVVDDGSDPPAAAAYAPADPRVRLLRQAAAGVSAARNRGLEEARGEYIAFLDADDLALPGRLEGQVRLLMRLPGAVLAGGDITRRALDGTEASWGLFEAFGEAVPAEAAGDDGWLLDPGFRDRVLLHYPFNASVVTATRAVAGTVRFDPALPCWEDWDFVARAARRGRVAYLRRPVALYRKRPGSITTTADPRKFLGRAAMFGRWLDEFEGLDEACRRALRTARNESWRTAAYEFRGRDGSAARRWALRALRDRPGWRTLRGLLGALRG